MAANVVTVLTPNGRRQTVKVSPNTPLLQILEDVCKKQGFNPDEHGLKFQRNVLDLTLQWRFTSLPNNAKLEMVPSTRKWAGADSQVRIALHMADGSRLQGSFSSGQNLWDLLTHFPQTSVPQLSDSGATPVCVYMRDEVSGEEALKKATLKSLGLTGGSAIVRFLLKNNETPEEQDGGEAAETAAKPTTPPAEESTPIPSSRPDLAPSQPETSTSAVQIKRSAPDRPAETLLTPAPVPATSTLPVQQEVVPTPQEAVRPEASPLGQGTPEEVVEEAGPSGLNSSSPPSAPFIPFSGGGQRLGGPGEDGGGRSFLSSSSSSSATSTSTPVSAMPAAVDSPKAKKAKPSHGLNTKCQAPANQEDEAIGQGEEFLEPVERGSLTYHLDAGSRHRDNHLDLPDEFFEVTVDDVRKRFAQLKSERRLFEESPLMTNAQRESQMREKMNRYPKVVLRVQFPDRYVLQGYFRPMETVAAVRCFVKSHLEDPLLCFYLFITPPKSILDDPSATLFQANLFPGAVVHFGSDVKAGCYLKKALLDSSVSALEANESIASCMPDSSTPSTNPPGPEDPLPPPEPAGISLLSTQHHQDPAALSQASGPAKVPKWLKLPGKK